MTGKLSIFLDPTGRRARLTNRTLSLIAAASILALAALAAALTINPKLPLVLDNYETARSSATPIAAGQTAALRYGAFHNRILPEQARSVMRMAMLDQRPGSLNSLKKNANKLDAIIPYWVRLSADGRVEFTAAKEIGQTRRWLQEHSPSLALYPQVEIDLRTRHAPLFLLDERRSKSVAASLAAFAVEHKFSGLTLPLNVLSRNVTLLHANFIYDLGRLLKASGKKLILQVEGGAIDAVAISLARAADFVLLDLTCDDAAGAANVAPASQGWFDAALEKAVASIDRRKLIIAVGSYAYDVADSGVREFISLQQAWNRITDAKAFAFDAASLNGKYAYKDARGTRHTIWLLDGATFYNQLRTALSRLPAGVALWRLGLEDPAVWAFAAKGQLPDDAAVSALSKPEPSLDPQGMAEGAIFSVSLRNAAGERDVVFDAGRGLILDERMRKLPQGALIRTLSKPQDDRVVLTFDDGPDARYTEPILDILKQRNVPAAFFIIGRNALMNPKIMTRIRDEGHEIGNHTFSHPNLKQRSSVDIAFELNATQRVLESQLGLRTVLFRAPYADMGADGDGDAFTMMDQVSRMGYFSVRITVDPRDWANPTPAQISDRVTAELAQADSANGHIVLLHDAGGSRRSTIAALPVLIDALRARGYRFVPLSEIIGKTRAELMPSTGPRVTVGSLLSHVADGGLGWLSWLTVSLPAIAIIAGALGIVRLAFIIGFALRHRMLERRRAGFKWRPQSLTVLVPAYNEEKVICKTIRSLLASRNRKCDIVVIDDGSSDETAEAVRRVFWKTPRVRVFKKPNGGKSAALNFGLRQTTADIVVALDADTVFAPDAIEKLVRHFCDPGVGAVAGRAVVGNEVTMMARFQSLEYVTSQNLDRRAFEQFNAIGVVPGAIGAWRRQPLIDVGGFPLDTLAEDADATIAMERAGWRVIYEPDAIALTEAPETVSAFLKQRFRWMYGTLQVSFKHRKAILQRNARGVGCITIPNIVIFQFAFTLLAPLMNLLLVLTLISEGREWALSSTGDVPESLEKIGAYWFFFQGIDSSLAAVGLALNGDRRRWRLFPLIFIQRFCYRQLLYFVAIKTLLAAARGQFVGWGKLLRTGNVQEAGRLVPSTA